MAADQALRNALPPAGIAVTDGPAESAFDNTWRWHVTSATGIESVISITALAFEEGADLPGLVSTDEFAARINDATEPRSIQVLSTLSIRDKPIDSLSADE